MELEDTEVAFVDSSTSGGATLSPPKDTLAVRLLLDDYAAYGRGLEDKDQRLLKTKIACAMMQHVTPPNIRIELKAGSILPRRIHAVLAEYFVVQGGLPRVLLDGCPQMTREYMGHRTFGGPEGADAPVGAAVEPKETRTLSEIADQLEQELPAIKRRLDHGADVNDAAEFKDGCAPLFLAAQLGHVEVLGTLADAGAELGWKSPRNGETALHVAAWNGHVLAVRSLAVRGGRAAVNARTDMNQTPLHCAAIYGRTAAVSELLEAGADASLRHDDGETALDFAVKLSKHQVAALLRH